MLIERYINGELVLTEEVEAPEQPEETVAIPKAAAQKLAEDMSDPSINSIAEIKSAINSFLEKVS